MTPTTTSSVLRRDQIRDQIGRKTPAELHVLAVERYGFMAEHQAWLVGTAERLEQSGYLTLADVTDAEFDAITA